ncbi:MAG: class I SAM-dependent methyltransferase [Treponema sp.]|nr:class I SAM-dependent methyltransferase [Treponema sp.]
MGIFLFFSNKILIFRANSDRRILTFRAKNSYFSCQVTPGIPLALSLLDSEKYRFTLIERMGKRAGFLRNTKAILGLSRVTIEEREMEQSPQGRFHLITFRAFRPLEPKLLTSLFRLLVPGGALFAYKGRQDTITAEMHRVEAALGSWEQIPLWIPFLAEERHLVVLRPPLQETGSR